MTLILREIRRSLKRNPVLSALSGLILVAGFAGSTLAFTVFTALNSPRFRGSANSSFVTLAEARADGGSGPLAWSVYEHLEQTTHLPGAVSAAYSEPVQASLGYAGNSRKIQLSAVSASFFPALTEGSRLTPIDSLAWDEGSGEDEVILSAKLSRQLFRSVSHALGRQVTLNGHSFRVAGVAPDNFQGLWSQADAWTAPKKMISLLYEERQQKVAAGNPSQALHDPISWRLLPAFYLLYRTPSAAHASLLSSLAQRVKADDNLQYRMHVTDGLSKDPLQDRKLQSWSQLGLAVCLALVFAAGLNYAGLLLAKAPQQSEEIRLQRVLGASTLRLVRDSAVGPVFLVLSAFLLASVVVASLSQVLRQSVLTFLPAGALSWRLLACSFAIEAAGVLSFSLLIALAPILRVLHQGGTPNTGYTATGSKWVKLAMQIIVTLQLASCMVMCLLAGTLVSTTYALSRQQLGFAPDHLTTIEVGPASKEAGISFSVGGEGDFPYAALTRSLLQEAPAALPETQSIAAASCAPYGQTMHALRVQLTDQGTDQGVSPTRFFPFCGVSQRYFETMGTAIYRGRGFSPDQFLDEVTEIVVNRALARELWPAQDPLLHTLRVSDPNFDGFTFTARVVGVADDMRMAGPGTSPEPTLYLPLKENVFGMTMPLYILARGTSAPQAMSAYVQRQAHIHMPGMGVDTYYRVDDRMRAAFLEQRVRLYLPLAGAFLLALIAYLGLYGVLAHAANSQRKELAIRVCFGASAWDVRRIILRQAILCALAAGLIAVSAWSVIALTTAAQWLGTLRWSWRITGPTAAACMATAILIALIPAFAASGSSTAESLKQQ